MASLRIAVPLLRREVFIRFVEEFEGQFGRIVLIMLGNLPPHGNKSLGVLVGLVKDFVVVVHVDHGNKMSFKGLIDGPIHAVEKLRVDAVWGRLVGMGRPADRDADRVESGLRDFFKI